MTTKRSPMSALIGLNAILLLMLAFVVMSPTAGGQATPARARGTYTMVAGKMLGTPEAAVYIIDATNQELIAAKWDRGRKALRFLGYSQIPQPRAGGSTTEPGR